MKKINYIIISMAFIASVFGSTSCKHEVGATTLVVQDSLRHYYPLLQGQELDVSYRIANVGEEPLVLTDIHPSCGCITMNGERNNIILPGKELTLAFKFDSSKNVGYVEQKIYLYGNIAPDGMATLVFDVNVVPPYGSAPDYEEWYYQNEKTDKLLKGITDGNENQRGYWVNDGDYPEDYSRNYKKYPWREVEKK